MTQADPAEPRIQSVQGIERALDVLSLFVEAESQTLGVTEIAQNLGLSKAVVHRILSTFRAKEFVEIDDVTHRYRLGPKILMLGLRNMDRLDFRVIAREAMTELVRTTNETATLSIRVGWDRVYIDQITPERDVKMVVQIGRPFPLHTGASSKALLAFLPTPEQEDYLASHELVAMTAHSITDPVKLRAELKSIRAKGHAVSFGERDDSAGSVAAPIFGMNDQLLGVISISGPAERFRGEAKEAAGTLMAATRGVSARMGHRA